MNQLKDEVHLLRQKKLTLDEQIDKEQKELQLLKDTTFELTIRRIVLEELLKKY